LPEYIVYIAYLVELFHFLSAKLHASNSRTFLEITSHGYCSERGYLANIVLKCLTWPPFTTMIEAKRFWNCLIFRSA